MRRIICAAFLAALLPIVAQRSASQDVAGSAADQARNALARKLSTAEHLDKRVVEAFDSVPRQRFVPAYLADMAYEDTSLPLGDGQTLPSPSDLLRAVQALDVRSTDRVLVVGADTGYLAALFSRLAAHVFDIELVPANRAPIQQIYTSLGFSNITVAANASVRAFAASGPFDRIFVHGAAATVPPTILAQLGASGKMVVPLRDPSGFQMVVELSRADGGTALKVLGKGFYAPVQLGG